MPKRLSARIQGQFTNLPGPRRRKALYLLINIVTIAVCAVVCGADDFPRQRRGVWFRSDREWTPESDNPSER